MRKNRRILLIRHEKNDHIVNLSNRELSPEERSLLSKGIQYIPCSPQEPDYRDAVSKLERSYRIKYFFKNSRFELLPHPPPFRKASQWIPPKADSLTEKYLSDLPSKLEKVPTRPWVPNITKAEWHALRNLSKNTDIVIKKADKGSCLVVQNKEDYVAEGVRHLSNKDIYSKIEGDPTPNLVKSINLYVSILHRKGYVSHDMRDYLTLPEGIRTQQLYFLRKLHKVPQDVRPIVSGVSGPTERLSSFMDYFLQPLVVNTASYVRDSKSLIAKIEHLVLPTDCILVTIDVKSLYPSIPQDEGIQSSVHHLFNNNPSVEDVPFPPSVAREILGIVLKHNYFEFCSEMYHQVRGTAMGTKVAPAFANLFMATLEKEFLATEPVQPLLWCRFIDDILCIWPGTESELNPMLERLNNFRPTIKFTYEVSDTKAVFLDFELHKGTRFRDLGILDVKPHFKDTNTFQYLHFSSAHPRCTRKGIVKGEMTRILRACSAEDTYNHCVKKLQNHFSARGYPTALIKSCINEVPFSCRTQTLEDKQAGSGNIPPVFITPYVRRVNQRALKEAIASPEGIECPMICYKRKKNVANYIVRARLPGTLKPAATEEPIHIGHLPSFVKYSAPCNKPLCKCCALMSRMERVHADNGTSHPTAKYTDCSSKNLIYLIQCKLCTKRNKYVGQTARPLRERLAGHRAAFLSGKKMPLYTHMRKKDHEFKHISVTVLQMVPRNRLLDKELTWIKNLGTRWPSGLNSKFY